MTLPTHLAFAAVLYLGGATLFGYKPDWLSGLLAAVASGLPDIDLPTSKICRLFWFISAPLERRFGHRTLTHSLVMLIALAVLTYPLTWLQPLYWGSVVGGYGSHLWLDMANVRGIDLLWPAPLRLVTPGNRHWRLTQLGCDLAQGYGIARPMPPERISAWIAGWGLPRSWADQAELERTGPAGLH